MLLHPFCKTAPPRFRLIIIRANRDKEAIPLHHLAQTERGGGVGEVVWRIVPCNLFVVVDAADWHLAIEKVECRNACGGLVANDPPPQRFRDACSELLAVAHPPRYAP